MTVRDSSASDGTEDKTADTPPEEEQQAESQAKRVEEVVYVMRSSFR